MLCYLNVQILSSNAPTCGFTDKEDGLVTVSTVERKERIL
jgi:hypothetical protein